MTADQVEASVKMAAFTVGYGLGIAILACLVIAVVDRKVNR